MDQKRQFENLCQVMVDPKFYPIDVTTVERRETHISLVFLTGKWVYKLKKPVSLEFLDFRKLTDRKKFCEAEVRLNQRLSNGIYKEVVSIAQDKKGNLSLSGDGQIIDYAVKMVQLPDDQNFAVLLKKGLITPGQIESLGKKLAAFHQTADAGDHIDTFGASELIRYNMEENFRQIYPFVEKLIPAEKWEFICQVSRSFIKDHKDLFHHRIKTRRIRDGHGDLRCDHVYFADMIQIIDCIEFNDRFRFGDTALDIAFLIMDLEHQGYPGIASRLLSVYAEESDDPEIYALLDFYAAYRAIVRLKITCFSVDDKQWQNAETPKIQMYLNQAYHHTVMFGRPTLWIFCGLPASGKSTLAQKIADTLFMPIFQSDVVRKQDQGHPTEEVVDFNNGIYQPVLRGRVYAELLNMAQDQIKLGKSVVLDATFSERKWQKAAVQLADDMDAGLIFVQCVCSPETMKSRLKKREEETTTSDARLIHFDEILKHAEPVQVKTENTRLTIDTEQPVTRAFYEILSETYSLRSSQTKRLIRQLNNNS